jgi:UrcA family protein
MLKTLSALAALLAASAIVMPTVSNAQDTVSVRVPYSDLNLASGTDQDRLKQRISNAAKYVCEGDLRNIDAVSAVFTCRAEATAGARPAYEAAVAEATRHGTVTVLESASLTVAKP